MAICWTKLAVTTEALPNHCWDWCRRYWSSAILWAEPCGPVRALVRLGTSNLTPSTPTSPSPTILPPSSLQIHNDFYRRVPRHYQHQILILRSIHRLMIPVRRHVDKVARLYLLLNL